MGQCFSSPRRQDCGDRDQTSRPHLSSTPLPASSSRHHDSGDEDQTSIPGSSSTPPPISSSCHHDGGDEDQTSMPGSSSTPPTKQNHMSHFSSSSCHHDSGDKDQTSRPGLSSTALTEQGYMSYFSSSSRHHDGGDRDQTSSPGSSSTAVFNQNYEVFLSFRGEDTRYGFTDHLYRRLDDIGIIVFRDNEELPVGEKIDQLLEAIKASRISVPIISPHYASSMWCLRELLQIVGCSKTSGQLVLPIIYKVKPSDVREQKGVFGENFRLSKETNNLDEKLVQDLQNAFNQVTSMKGWESDKIADGYEGALVEIVVRRIFNKLRKSRLSLPDQLVGVEEHIEAIKKEFDDVPPNEAKIIVIHGMGGIGKTTLASALYNNFFEEFESQCFVANIREASSNDKGMEGLQKQMASRVLGDKLVRDISCDAEGKTIIESSFRGKRLLLVLDDVNDKDQLDKLAAERNWFAPKSIVIITTRNKDIAQIPVVNLSYELNQLNDDQSHKLFCRHAFGPNASCPENLETLARNIVSRTGGLPLAIKVIGSLLCRKSESFWRATNEKLRTIQNIDVYNRLKLSYDALDYTQRQIFLDIAFFPHVFEYYGNVCRVGSRIRFATYMWEKCGFYPGEGIDVLASLSLIEKIDEDLVVMHDQLKELGREIVRKESSEIGERSRLWLYDEATEGGVLERKQGAKNIQTLRLENRRTTNHYRSEQFEGMDNLRFLCVYYGHLIGDFENLFPNLRWFEWTLGVGNIPSEPMGDFMGSNFNPKGKKLVILHLESCNITQYWKGWSQMKDLKVMKLHDCSDLTTMPDLSALKELEFLDLSYCRRLKTIHPSIGKFRKTLKYLRVYRCEVLEELPPEVGKMEELRELDISETPIKEIPISDGYMKNLKTLRAHDCGQLKSIPDSIGSLLNLQCLNIRGCTSIEKIPESIGNLCNLEELDIDYTPIKCFPISFGKLRKLGKLGLGNCRELESLSNLPCNLRSLEFHGNSMETLIDISNLTILKHLTCLDLSEKRNTVLNVGNMNQLESLEIFFEEKRTSPHLNEDVSGSQGEIEISNPEKEMYMAPENFTLIPYLPSSLVKLAVYDCQSWRILSSLSKLKNLLELSLINCSELMEINILEGAESLTRLRIARCRKLSRLGDLSNLKMLTDLELKDCEKLSDVEGMEKLTSLTCLHISGCNLTMKDAELMEIPWLQDLKSLKTLHISSKSLPYLPDLSYLTELQRLDISDCEKLVEIRGILNMESLRALSIEGCTALRKLPDLSMLRFLNSLTITDVDLMEIPWLQELKSLKTLQISSKSLQYLPDLSHLTELCYLDISDCEKLIEIRGIENMKSLRELSIEGCIALGNLPELPNVLIDSDGRQGPYTMMRKEQREWQRKRKGLV